jgi:hypothetical protein
MGYLTKCDLVPSVDAFKQILKGLEPCIDEPGSGEITLPVHQNQPDNDRQII